MRSILGIVTLVALCFGSSFDLRDSSYMPSVKDQGMTSLCWTYATMNVLEYQAAKIWGGSYDFSESHLSHDAATVGGTYGEGGDIWFINHYLLNNIGPINNDDEFYPSDSMYTTAEPQLFVGFSQELPTIQAMQTALLEVGPTVKTITTAIDTSQAKVIWDPATNCHYNPFSSPDHMISVVGWDDDFTTFLTPEKGAFLCKNSWGTGYGDDGYFWVSYADAAFSKETGTLYGGVVEGDAVTGIFSNDMPGTRQNSLKLNYTGDELYTAARITAYTDKTIRAMGILVNEPTRFTISFYKNLAPVVKMYDTLTMDPGTVTAVAEFEGEFTYPGYQIFPLSSPLLLDAGETYTAVIHYKDTPSGVLIGFRQGDPVPPGNMNLYSKNGTEWFDVGRMLPSQGATIPLYLYEGDSAKLSRITLGNGTTFSEPHAVAVSPVTSIKREASYYALSVQNRKLQITSDINETASIYLISLNGRKGVTLGSESLRAGTASILTLPHLASGIWIVNVRGLSGTLSQRIVIQ